LPEEAFRRYNQTPDEKFYRSPGKSPTKADGPEPPSPNSTESLSRPAGRSGI
jgi:hypothetical protein